MKYFLYGLSLLFIGLKLGGVIERSRWLVLLPIYGGFVIALLLIPIGLLIQYFQINLITKSMKKNRK